MSIDVHQKIRADHLKRDAFLYIRQSSLRQVFENTESDKRQYALRERAVALGGPSSGFIRLTAISVYPAHTPRTATVSSNS